MCHSTNVNVRGKLSGMCFLLSIWVHRAILPSHGRLLYIVWARTVLCSLGQPGTWYVDQVGLELTEIPWFCLPSAGITGIYHHTWPSAVQHHGDYFQEPLEIIWSSSLISSCFMPILFVYFSLRQGFPMYSWLALNFQWSSCLCLSCSLIPQMCHHTRLDALHSAVGIEFRTLCLLGKFSSAEPTPHHYRVHLVKSALELELEM